MAYAYGRPRDRSMNVIVHTVALAPDGSVVPRRVETGSAGLARTAVRTFSARPPGSRTWSRPRPLMGSRRSGVVLLVLVVVVTAVVVLVVGRGPTTELGADRQRRPLR